MKEVIIEGALSGLKSLPDGSVNCIVTSPPYYRLRKYSDNPDELGQEATPQEYVQRLVGILREARRVLRKDGTLWLNLGDSYASGKTGRTDNHRRGTHGSFEDGIPNEKLACGESTQTKAPAGFNKKSLLMIPSRVAIAMGDDGWILRSEIVWKKPSCIPESVKDRPTRSHEMVYLFSKSEHYFYDWEKARDESKDAKDAKDASRGTPKRRGEDQLARKADLETREEKDIEDCMMANWRDVWTVSHTERNPHIAVMPINLVKRCIIAGCPEGGTVLDPFAGSGTTGKAALELKRVPLLIELNPKFEHLINERMNNVQPPLFL